MAIRADALAGYDLEGLNTPGNVGASLEIRKASS
jgi:hypothetical protein